MQPMRVRAFRVHVISATCGWVSIPRHWSPYLLACLTAVLLLQAVNVCGVIRKPRVMVTPAVYRSSEPAPHDEHLETSGLSRGARKKKQKNKETVRVRLHLNGGKRRTIQLALQTPSSRRRLPPVLARPDAFHFERNVQTCRQNVPGPPVMREEEDGYDDDCYY